MISGVVAMLVNDKGDVIASSNDFEKCGYGGFELHEAQKMRAKNKLKYKTVRAFSSPAFYECLSESAYQRCFDDLIKSNFSIHYEFIRQEEETK